MSIDTLYQDMRAGDTAAERQLFKKLSESFRLFAQHRLGDERDAEEVVQEALMTIAQKHQSTVFETSFKSWAYRVLENKILDCYRARQYRMRRFIPLIDHDSRDPRPACDVDLRRRLIACLKEVAGVNTRFARVLSLHYQGYTTGDICARLALSRNGVYVLLSRARSMLKSCLEEGEIHQ